jgi:lipoate-protein ligase A
LVDLTLPSPEENLALDEALLGLCSRASPGTGREFLRFWESRERFVVLGVSGRLQAEVRTAECARDGIPVLRRVSGGGTVLQGPGCLSYALVLSLAERPDLRDLSRSYATVLERVAQALGIPDLGRRGTSDLAIGERKISGSAQKRTPGALLHHGTILHRFDATTVSRWLREPEKQPAYRAGRFHEAFLDNVALSAEEIKSRLAAAWSAVQGPFEIPPLKPLIEERYGQRGWNERF